MGAVLLTGARGFLAGESEWPRVIGEVGLVLGLAFILFRLLVVWHLFRKALAALRRGEPLAMLIFGMCAIHVLNGQLGAAATLGWAVFGAGLCLAAAKEEEEPGDGMSPLIEAESRVVPKVRGRSAYAEQLHSSKRTT